MKKLFYTIFCLIISIPQVFAAVDGPAQTTTANPAKDGFTLIPKGTITGCNFASGEMSFDCIPNYISYLINIIVGIAGTLAVIFIMIGGFKYIFSAISDDKEAGKETIINAIIGLVVTGLAWIIVTMVVSLVTQ